MGCGFLLGLLLLATVISFFLFDDTGSDDG